MKTHYWWWRRDTRTTNCFPFITDIFMVWETFANIIISVTHLHIITSRRERDFFYNNFVFVLGMQKDACPQSFASSNIFYLRDLTSHNHNLSQHYTIWDRGDFSLNFLPYEQAHRHGTLCGKGDRPHRWAAGRTSDEISKVWRERLGKEEINFIRIRNDTRVWSITCQR